jgi:hypothetical protein
VKENFDEKKTQTADEQHNQNRTDADGQIIGGRRRWSVCLHFYIFNFYKFQR